MSKALKTAAIIVGVVALAVAIPGVGAAIGTAIGVSAGTVVAVTTIAASVLTLAAGLTAKKPSAADATGSPTSFSADPDDGMPLALGRTGNAGQIIFRKEFDTADAGVNDRQAFVAALSIGPIAAVEGQTVDRSPVSFASGAALGAFAGFMWSMTQIGAMPEASALGFGSGAGTPSGWTSAHKLSGLAAASWTLRFDTKSKLYQNGVPAPMWVVRGALAWDPRKDSTYLGGSGPHRMADPADTAAYDAAVATWEWTEDPYLLGLRWAHGFWQRDKNVAGSKWTRVMGMGAAQGGIDVAAFVEGANIALANGWTCGGMIYSGDDKWDSMKRILQAGMGEPLALGAKISCLVNAPKVSLATITVDDVIGDASVTGTQPRRDRINTVTPRYRLEANNWELLPGAPITVPEYVTTDRGKRSKVIDYPFIQNTPQVGTATRYDIENAREFGPIVLPLKLVWMGYKPGDCVTATLPELGLNAQPILLLNRSLSPADGTVTMTARSETPAKHAYALGQSATPPPTPALTGPALVPVPGAAAWAITGTSLASANATLPALIVSGAVDVGTAEAIVFEYRPFVSGQAADLNWRAAGVEKPETGKIEIASVQAGTAYEVSVSYRARGVTGARRILGPVTTAGVATQQAQAALDAAAAAQTLAAGKTQYWIQSTPPTAAQTGDNDVWISTGEGNRAYQRIPGTGRLAIGGNRLTIGGNYLVVAPWKPADDQRIATALLAAAGAQATADGKVFVFKQEATPTALGIGDLWDKPSTGALTRWSGTAWEIAADQTALAQITVSLVQAIDVAADYTGAIAAGTLPKTIFPTVKRGGADITLDNATSYALSGFTGGCTSSNITVDNANGSASKGQITVGTGWASSGAFTLYVSYNATLVGSWTITVTKKTAAPPSGGGSGSGGFVKNGTFNASGRSVTSTTLVEIARIANMAKADGETIRGYFNASYDLSGGQGERSLLAKWQYSAAGANSWTDMASAVTGSPATYIHNSTGDGHTLPGPDDPPEWEISSGAIACNQTVAPATGNYDMRLLAAIDTSGTLSLVISDGPGSVAIAA